MTDTWPAKTDTSAMQSTNQDERDTMSDKQNIDEQNLERGGVEVEGQASGYRFEPEQDVEGQGFYRGRDDSKAPENTDVSDADAAAESEVEGQFRAVRFEPTAEVEGHGARAKLRQDVEGQSVRVRIGASDSEAPENTDVSDAEAAEGSEVEGQAIRGDFEPAEVEGHGVKGKFEPEQDVEGQGFRWGKTDSEAPENTDVNDSTDEPEVEGQGAKWI